MTGAGAGTGTGAGAGTEGFFLAKAREFEWTGGGVNGTCSFFLFAVCMSKLRCVRSAISLSFSFCALSLMFVKLAVMVTSLLRCLPRRGEFK